LLSEEDITSQTNSLKKNGIKALLIFVSIGVLIYTLLSYIPAITHLQVTQNWLNDTYVGKYKAEYE
jgi:hypothetical protein